MQRYFVELSYNGSSFFGWLVTPALAIQVFPTGPSPTLGARSGVGMLRAVRERRV